MRWTKLLATLALLAGACGGDRTIGWRDAASWDYVGLGDLWSPGSGSCGSGSGYGYGYGYGGGGNCPDTVTCGSGPCIHGQCVATDGGDACLCDLGYAGLHCDVCASGYTPRGLICVASGPCAASPCIYGTCRPESDGTFECDCLTGYAGTRCDVCASGYHAENAENLECVPD
jgi:hypothetical protein